jgi:hypothetical protein
MLIYRNKQGEFDLCEICLYKGTDNCLPCEIRHAFSNEFYPNEEKIREMLGLPAERSENQGVTK